MLVHNQIQSLHNGVSQQQAELRLDSQVDEMINATPTLTVGLRKRNPTELITTGAEAIGDSGDYIYSYDRGLSGDEKERYFISVNATGIKVLDADTGLQKTVNYVGSSLDYLTPFYPYNGYSITTVKDTSYITNRNKTVTSSTGSGPAFDEVAYMWIERGEPTAGYVYQVNLNAIAIESTGMTTSILAAADIATLVSAETGFTGEAMGSVVKITGPSGFTFSTDDSFGGQASYGWKGYAVNISDLPKNFGFEDVIVKITGTDTLDNDGYYVKYINNVWIEHYNENVTTSIDASTMPHKLTRESDGTFTLEEIVYEPRAAGDVITNEDPYFVDNEISDVFFHGNRFCFISNNSIQMSEIGRYFNFYRTTVLALIDSDPINVIVSSKQAVSLSYAVEGDDSILIFSDKAQFSIDTTSVITPNSMQVTQSTAYEFNTKARPVVSNGFIFFLSLKNDYTSVYEYQPKTYGSTSRLAVDVTSHIQTYIDGDIVQVVSSPVHNMLFLRSSTNTDIIYGYKYTYDGDKRVQAAWFKWSFNGNIHGIGVFNDTLYLRIDRAGPEASVDWVVAGGVWSDVNVWKYDELWQDGAQAITRNVEKIPLTPHLVTHEYLDNGNTTYPTVVSLSEWIYTYDGIKDIAGHLNYRTVEISSEPDSDFTLRITDTKNDKFRDVLAKYTVDKRPAVMGAAEKMRISIKNDTALGFQINTISNEGTLTQRSAFKK